MPDYGVPDYSVPDYGVPDYGVLDYRALDCGAPDRSLPDCGASNYGAANYRTSDYGRTTWGMTTAMARTPPRRLVLGEFRRTLDERYRLALPAELLAPLFGEVGAATLAKERAGCLSIWNPADWQRRSEQDLALLEHKLQAGRFDGRIAELQRLSRLISSREVSVALAQRGRFVVPEGFREFLGVEPGGEVMLLGAGVCVELWHPAAWQAQLAADMPLYRQLFEQLAS